jgi:hypothetical protein
LAGFGRVCVGQPGSCPAEHGITTGRYTWPQDMQIRVATIVAASRAECRTIIETPEMKF